MKIIELTNETFENEVLNSDKPVLVDFWATWCGPCKMAAPIVEKIAGEHDEIKVCKVDVDENPELARKYKVFSIPTFVVFRGGEAVRRTVGAVSEGELLDLLS